MSNKGGIRPSKRTTVTEEILNSNAVTGAPLATGEEIPPDVSNEELEEYLAIEDFVSSFGANVQKVRIYRVERNGDVAFCGEYAPGTASDATIQDEFGGGKYVVKLVNSQGQYVKQRQTVIAEKIKKDPREEFQSILKELGVKNSGTDGTAILQMQLKMMESQETRNTALITALIGALGNGAGKNGGGSAADIVQAVVALKTATEPTNGMFDGFAKIIELAKAIVPGNGGGEDNIYSVIKETLPAIAEAFTGRAAQQRSPQANPPANPDIREVQAGNAQPVVIEAGKVVSALPGQVQAQAVPVPVGESDMQRQVRLLTEAVGFLKEKARKNRDVGLYVDFVMEEEEDDERMSLLVNVIDHYSFEALIANDPEISGNPAMRKWFEEFYNAIKNEISNTDDSKRTTGDTSNANENGGANAASGTTSAGS